MKSSTAIPGATLEYADAQPDLKRDIADVRLELCKLRAEIKQDIADLGHQMTTQFLITLFVIILTHMDAVRLFWRTLGALK